MPSKEEGAVEARKAEHLELAARPDVDAAPAGAWHDIYFEHEALPECNLEDVDLSVTFLGHRLEAPLVIAGMTGGHRAAEQINAALAAGAGRSGLALGVGSQRAALVNPELSSTYSVVRAVAPSAFIIGNVGIAQLLPQASGPPLSLEQLQAAVEMVRANALAVHLNFLEESVQPEGDRHAAGGLAAVERVATALPIPVVVKETGGGISRSTAFRLASAGVAALDVGGSGGTSPLLLAARDGEQAVHAWVDCFLHELRSVMFLLGARTLGELRRTRLVVTGTTHAWLEQLGLEYGDAAQEA